MSTLTNEQPLVAQMPHFSGLYTKLSLYFTFPDTKEQMTVRVATLCWAFT